MDDRAMMMITNRMLTKKESFTDKVTYITPEAEILTVCPGMMILTGSSDNEEVGDGGELDG